MASSGNESMEAGFWRGKGNSDGTEGEGGGLFQYDSGAEMQNRDKSQRS